MAICEAEVAGALATTVTTERLPDSRLDGPSSLAPRDCADIMGIRIDRTQRNRVLNQVEQFVQSGRPHQIVTVNVDFLNIAHRDPTFVELLNDAAIAVPDGMPLLWVSRLVGQRLPERITGTDLLCDCADLAAQRGYRMFLLGAAPGVAEHAGRVLQERYPGLNIVGCYSPPDQGQFTAEENAHMIEMIRAARPDMLFVALGTPKQERWIYDNLHDLGVPLCVGIGGVFNFITGRIPRAPERMQRAGLEWFFRLMLEPRRLWRRYLVDDSRALYRAMRYAARRRFQGGGAPRAVRVPAAPRRAEADWTRPSREVAGMVSTPDA